MFKYLGTFVYVNTIPPCTTKYISIKPFEGDESFLSEEKFLLFYC